jgi:Zn-dependent protease with chaperone function
VTGAARAARNAHVTDPAAYSPVPGPVDRDSFFDAQARHRRASWWFTALAAVTVALMGVPLSAVISPLLYALAVVVLDVVNLVVRVPDLLAAFASHDSGSTAHATLGPAQVAVVAAFVLVPGSVLLLLSWVGVRGLFRRAGTGGTVAALGAREPSGELEERQLVNVVAEMAVAAGVPVPAVRVLDSPVANAGVVGSRIDDATVVVTTGLLDALDRDQTQGVVGHLVGSLGNGDLRIGTTIASVFQTLGLVGSVLRAPSEGRPRTTLRRLLRYAFSRHTADDRAALADLLTRAGADYGSDYGDTADKPWKSVLLLPFVMAGGAFQLTEMIYSASCSCRRCCAGRGGPGATSPTRPPSSSPATRTGWPARWRRSPRRATSYPGRSGRHTCSSWGGRRGGRRRTTTRRCRRSSRRTGSGSNASTRWARRSRWRRDVRGRSRGCSRSSCWRPARAGCRWRP